MHLKIANNISFGKTLGMVNVLKAHCPHLGGHYYSLLEWGWGAISHVCTFSGESLINTAEPECVWKQAGGVPTTLAEYLTPAVSMRKTEVFFK